MVSLTPAGSGQFWNVPWLLRQHTAPTRCGRTSTAFGRSL